VSTFVVLHGAFHGSWCWEKVVPLLERSGHRVVAPDLPGHGEDRTPLPEISLRGYADRVCRELDASPEPVILVGHSLGGVVISQAAEYRPHKVELLIYLSGNLLRDGEALVQVTQADTESLVTQNLVVDEERGIATVREEAIRDAFYGDCSEEEASRAESLVQPEPLAPMATPISLSEENFGGVRRVYVECLRDRANSPAAQKRMYTAVPCQTVVSLDTGHSPFWCAPQDLVAQLTALT
jgi:pimeloyl-ACP methyl ester carboxylesterase